MKHEDKRLPGLLLQIASAGVLCSLVLLLGGLEQETHFYPLMLIPWGAALYLLNLWFLRRSRTVRALVLFQVALSVLAFAAAVVSGERNWVTLLYAAAFLAWLSISAVRSVMKAPELRSLMLCMEINLVILVAFTLYCGVEGVEIQWCAVPAFGCAAAILAVMLDRIEDRLSLRGWCMIAAAFGLIFLLLTVLMAFAAAPAGGGVVALWDLLLATLRWMLGVLGRILKWIASLFQPPELAEYEPEPPAQILLPEQMEEVGTYGPMLLVMAAALSVMLVYLLVRLMIHLGGLRIGGRAVSRKTAAVRARPPLRSGLRRLWQELRANLRLRLQVWHRRSTPEGLLWILIRRCRMGPWHKRPGETPREFLTRLREASAAAGDEELRAAMDRLIPAVDAAVYAPARAVEPLPEAALIRRRIGAAVRRQFAADTARGLKRRLHKT